LNYHKFIKSYLKKKNKTSNFIISFALSQGLKLKDTLLKKNKLVLEEASNIELSTDFDSEFDVFWDELLKRNDDVLLADRSAETLRWHYKSRLASKMIIVRASRTVRRTLLLEEIFFIVIPRCQKNVQERDRSIGYSILMLYRYHREMKLPHRLSLRGDGRYQ